MRNLTVLCLISVIIMVLYKSVQTIENKISEDISGDGVIRKETFSREIRVSKVKNESEDMRPFSENSKIFISMASYRDKECSGTIEDMYNKAKYPERVITAICEQILPDKESEEACLPENFFWENNTRVIRLPAAAAKGPTYARALLPSFYDGEDLFMQVDSHGQFFRHWDEIVIQEMNKCARPRKSVLTYYPPADDKMEYENEEIAMKEAVPHICRAKYTDRDLISFHADLMAHTENLRPGAFIAAGFFIAPGTILKDVPFDPTLDHLFTGEELLYSARAWTSGYDIFAPTRNIMGHKYYRYDAPKYWNDINYAQIMLKTETRVKRILHMIEPYDIPGYPYGLGTERTIDEYWNYAGIDVKTKNITSHLKFCV